MPMLIIKHDSAPTCAPTRPGFIYPNPQEERVISKGHSRLFMLAERLKRSPRFRVLAPWLFMSEIPVGQRWLAWGARQVAAYDLD